VKNYRVDGIIEFFFDGKSVMVKHFSTFIQRQMIIKDFLQSTRNITDRYKLGWIISIDENSVEKIPVGKKQLPKNIVKDDFGRVVLRNNREYKKVLSASQDRTP
jgi:hypothetical protein